MVYLRLSHAILFVTPNPNPGHLRLASIHPSIFDGGVSKSLTMAWHTKETLPPSAEVLMP